MLTLALDRTGAWEVRTDSGKTQLRHKVLWGNTNSFFFKTEEFLPSSDLSSPMEKASICHNDDPITGRDPSVRAVPVFLMCRASHDKQVVWLTDKNYLNSVRQTLAASVIFFFFVCCFFFKWW